MTDEKNLLAIEDLPPGRVRLTLETKNQFSVYEADKGTLTEDNKLIFTNAARVAHGNLKGITRLYFDAPEEGA